MNLFKFGVIAWVFVALCTLAFWGGVIYLIVHFASKFW